MLTTTPSIFRCTACAVHSATCSEILWDCLPVPCFGVPKQVGAVTVSLNPSNTEFYKSGNDAPKLQEKRLPMLQDYGVVSREHLTELNIIATHDEQNEYFEGYRKPHRWFRDWSNLLRSADASWSYEEGTVAHIDIVACATSNQWSKLNPVIQGVLQANCRNYFISTLGHVKNGGWVLVNGRSTWRALASMMEEDRSGAISLPLRPKRPKVCEWSMGSLMLPSGKVLRYLAWNLNMQAARLPAYVREALGRLIQVNTHD